MTLDNFQTLYRKSFASAKNRASSGLSGFNRNNLRFNSSQLPKNTPQILVVLLLLGLAFFAGARFAPQTNLNSLGSSLGSFDERVDAPAPLASQTLNKKFEFPLRDDKDREVAKITYLLESASLQDAFIYQGKLAKAVVGRTFLILNVKITNPYTKSININARDYVRIKVNDSKEQLAPEIHNDPVEVQADSTKYTRIGLPINDTDTNLTLLIGELDGKKQTIKLTLER